jgi:hypothetical protein
MSDVFVGLLPIIRKYMVQTAKSQVILYLNLVSCTVINSVADIGNKRSITNPYI